jgi:hypothetical protein
VRAATTARLPARQASPRHHPRLAKGTDAGLRPHQDLRSGLQPTLSVCGDDPLKLPQAPSTYLLGLHLGDGCLTPFPREVYRLRIICTNRSPQLMRECELAMAEVLSNKVSRVAKTGEGCTEVASYSKHWLCMFPQHGPGRKHQRKIELTVWQQELVDVNPRPLVRGLLHSDGCRVLNWVNGTPYPRYHFSNVSTDIKAIFGRPVTSWASSGGRTAGAACRWPGGGVWRCWTSSRGRSGEAWRTKR